MTSYEEIYLDKRPQSLCKMCGKCCRFVTIPQSYEEVQKLASEGHEGAIDFLKLFVPYESIEEARNIDAAAVDNVINLHKQDGKFNENLKFYHCRFIREDNLCGNYENRPVLCNHFPSTPWAIVPVGAMVSLQRSAINRISKVVISAPASIPIAYPAPVLNGGYHILCLENPGLFGL